MWWWFVDRDQMKNKIKVIQIAHASHSYFANEKDSVKSIVLNDWYFKVAKQLKKFYPKIEVECWAPEKTNEKYEEFYESGIKLRFFPTTFSPRYALDFSISMLKELKKEIEKSKKQNYKLILHLHEIHNLHSLLIATIFKNEKIVVQHHGGSWPLKHLKENKKFKIFFPFFFLGQLWENKILKNVDCFFALSQEEINYLKKNAPNSKIKFQTMGIEDEYFKRQDKKEARKKLNLSGKKLIIFLGRVSETKGISYLIEAMKKLPDVELKIMGYGKERKKFENRIREDNLKNVEFLGGIFGKKKLLYLSAADAFILPSSKEGAPVTIMEAMAKNLPIIATNVGGISLMIEDGKNGIIIPPKSPKEIVKAVKEILKWKNKNIKKYANVYKWKKIIDCTVKEYLQK